MIPCVLLVDDEPRILRGLRRVLLEQPGAWDVHTAGSADEALSRIRQTAFDVIVTDVNMPGGDGFSLLDEIRREPATRRIPVIVVTGQKEEDLKRRALELGAVDLLSKPVHPQDLLARLNNACRLKQYEDQLRGQNALLEQRVAERTAELSDSRRDIIWKLGSASEHRDEETGHHIVRVGCYCRLIARALALDDDLVETLFLASPLHDIGKIGIPDSVLRKRGPLSPDEWEIMKRHCEIGAEILREGSRTMQIYRALRLPGAETPRPPSPNPILTMASCIALTHHERWNGSGYPAALSGLDIPLPSRIVALADTYDALRSERPYKPELSADESLEIIEADAGRLLDPDICFAFRDLHPEIEAIRSALADWPSPAVAAEHPA